MQLLSRIFHPRSYLRINAPPPAPGKVVIISVHGIYATDSGWEAQASAYFASLGFVGQFLSYWTGMFLWRNNENADKLAAMVAAAYANGAGAVDLLCHSNGCLLALLALARNPSMRVRNLCLIAGACKPDCDPNGLNAFMAGGRVQTVVAGISRNDGVVGSFAQWIDPAEWGNTMGVDGLLNPSYSMSACAFSSANIQTTAGVTGRDDSKSHLTWMGPDVYEIVAARAAA